MVVLQGKQVSEQNLSLLLEAEQDIQKAWQLEGLALKRIRDNQLYEARGYTSFSRYYENEFGYHKSTVSLRIKAAETAQRVRITEQKFNPSQVVFRELASVPPEQQQSILDKACELSLLSKDNRVQAKHVRSAIQEAAGGYAVAVMDTARKWGFLGDLERMNILQGWYERGGDSHDGKFWSIFHSGTLDPQDGKAVVSFAEDTISDIRDGERRWQSSKIIADNPNPAIEGFVNEARLVVDGQNIAQDWQGKRVRIRIDILEDKG